MRTPTVPPLLVASVTAPGSAAPDGVADPRLETEAGTGWRRGAYRPSGEGPVVQMWRVGPRPGPPPGWPGRLPFLPGVSCVAVTEGALASVTWPDEAPPRDPGASGSAGGRFETTARPTRSEGGGAAFGAGPRYGGRRPTPEEVTALVEGLERLVDRAAREGWRVVSDERLDDVVRGRVVRWRREGLERAASLTESLGVVQLTWLEAPGP